MIYLLIFFNEGNNSDTYNSLNLFMRTKHTINSLLLYKEYLDINYEAIKIGTIPLVFKSNLNNMKRTVAVYLNTLKSVVIAQT